MNAARTEDSSWNHDRIAVFIEHFNQNSYCQIQPWLLFSRASKKVRMMINVDTQQLGGTKKNLENEQKGRNSAAQREEERKKSGFNFIGAKLLFKSQLIKWDAWVVLPNFKVVFKLTTVFFFQKKLKTFCTGWSDEFRYCWEWIMLKIIWSFVLAGLLYISDYKNRNCLL